jgi:hypothetical protein
LKHMKTRMASMAPSVVIETGTRGRRFNAQSRINKLHCTRHRVSMFYVVK